MSIQYTLTKELNRYNRDEAVKYAITYALTPNPDYKYLSYHGDGGGDCTNFISQCLNAGGAPMDFKSQKPWWYNHMETSKNDDKWSVSWSVAHALYWCLKSRAKLNLPGLKATEVSDISMLEAGDIIQYENADGIIYHSTIITSFINEKGSQKPLITQHSFNAVNISYVKPAAKKMHFMKIRV